MDGLEHHPRVGIRELRQNLSLYVDRVRAGEALLVTEHGHVVAQLGPVPERPNSLLERMVGDGRITPARIPVPDLPRPVQARPGSKWPSELLRMARERAGQ